MREFLTDVCRSYTSRYVSGMILELSTGNNTYQDRNDRKYEENMNEAT